VFGLELPEELTLDDYMSVVVEDVKSITAA
jgi:hypothetical protein